MGLDTRKSVLGGFGNNKDALAQSDQRLCYSLIWKVSYVDMLQAKFQFSS